MSIRLKAAHGDERLLDPLNLVDHLLKSALEMVRVDLLHGHVFKQRDGKHIVAHQSWRQGGFLLP